MGHLLRNKIKRGARRSLSYIYGDCTDYTGDFASTKIDNRLLRIIIVRKCAYNVGGILRLLNKYLLHRVGIILLLHLRDEKSRQFYKYIFNFFL